MKVSILFEKTFLFLAFLLFLGCSGEETPLVKEEISASVSGEAPFVSSKEFDTVFGTKVILGKTTTLILQGTDASGRGFLLRVSPYEGPKTYEFGMDPANNLAVWINRIKPKESYSTDFKDTSGNLVVTLDENRVLEGTFGFKGKLSDTSAVKTVTNGKFKVNLD
jgi:hypothetical protein